MVDVRAIKMGGDRETVSALKMICFLNPLEAEKQVTCYRNIEPENPLHKKMPMIHNHVLKDFCLFSYLSFKEQCLQVHKKGQPSVRGSHIVCPEKGLKCVALPLLC